MKRYFLLCLTAVCFFTLHAQQTEYVVVAVIDGARYTETFGDPTHTKIPRIWNQLRPLGTIYTAFTNDSITLTVPGHASIVTGTWQNLPNDGTQRPTQPTIFEYFRKQHSVDSTACWLVLGKSKLDVLSSSTHAEYGQNYSASVRTSSDEYNDLIAWDNTRWVLQHYHPRLTVVNFPMTDYRGHVGVWDEYLSAIQETDTLVASLWNIIQDDPILRNKTTMVITNDHGRHTDYFTNHGDGCEGCRHIMLLIIGPDTPADVVDSMPHAQVDIAPTIGALIKFTTPYSTGYVIQSAVVTGATEFSSQVPRVYALRQSYPNPFNPTTIIIYQLPSIDTQNIVSLRVYDLLGREVATLVNEYKPAGTFMVSWDASHLPSGIYFGVLQHGRKQLVQKMVLLK